MFCRLNGFLLFLFFPLSNFYFFLENSQKSNSYSSLFFSLLLTIAFCELAVKIFVKKDNEVKTTKTLSVGPSVQNSQIQKSSLLCTAPTDISTSRAYKPTQTRLKEYPKHSERKYHARSFVGAWFHKYKWAEYFQQRDAMLCFACRHFVPATYGNVEDAFIKCDFRRWKKALGKDGSIARHLNSHCQKTSSLHRPIIDALN